MEGFRWSNRFVRASTCMYRMHKQQFDFPFSHVNMGTKSSQTSISLCWHFCIPIYVFHKHHYLIACSPLRRTVATIEKNYFSKPK